MNLWQTTNFYHYLASTPLVAVISTVIALVDRLARRLRAVPLPVASVHHVAGHGADLPGPAALAVVLPMYDISKAIGIYDTTYAMAAALVAINQPFTIWLLRNFFAEIPGSSTRLPWSTGAPGWACCAGDDSPDGTGDLDGRNLRVSLRLPGVPDRAVLTDVNAKTVPVFIATQIGQTLPMLQQASAATILLTLPVIAIAFVAQKYLVAGLNSGAVKADRIRRALGPAAGMNCSAEIWSRLDRGGWPPLITAMRPHRGDASTVRSAGYSTNCRADSRSAACLSAASWPWR